jgi:hypothetical protein
MEFNILDQRRIIRDPNNIEEINIPRMPLVIALDNGVVGEATSIRGLMSIILGNEYFDAEDSEIEWFHRLFAARKESMKAIGRNIFAEVYDSRKGVIKNNYAKNPEDPDYEVEPDAGESVKIRIENDRLFLLSLLKIGAFIILEREDSFQLREHLDWEKYKKKEKRQGCSGCLHRIIDHESSGLVCPVYNANVSNEDGHHCVSYTLPINREKPILYEGGEYIEIGQAYDLDELMNQIGQEWILR